MTAVRIWLWRLAQGAQVDVLPRAARQFAVSLPRSLQTIMNNLREDLAADRTGIQGPALNAAVARLANEFDLNADALPDWMRL